MREGERVGEGKGWREGGRKETEGKCGNGDKRAKRKEREEEGK